MEVRSCIYVKCRAINLRCIPLTPNPQYNFNPQMPCITFFIDFFPKEKALQLLILERELRGKGE